MQADELVSTCIQGTLAACAHWKEKKLLLFWCTWQHSHSRLAIVALFNCRFVQLALFYRREKKENHQFHGFNFMGSIFLGARSKIILAFWFFVLNSASKTLSLYQTMFVLSVQSLIQTRIIKFITKHTDAWHAQEITITYQ